MHLTFITDYDLAPDGLDGEFIHFGSPRLFQIFQSVKKNGRFIRLYEEVESNGQQFPLHPWLGVNVTISYQSDLKKDKLLSLGLHLISGTIVESFQEKINKHSFTAHISDYCYSVSPLIKLESGLKRLETFIEHIAKNEPNDWATASIERWNYDRSLLEKFYEDVDDKPQEYELEKQALQSLYEPKIIIKIESGGLFYLKNAV